MEHVPEIPSQDDDSGDEYPGLQVQAVATEPRVGEEEGVTLGVGLELPKGWALPPAHEPGGSQGVQVPVVPVQRMLPSTVDA